MYKGPAELAPITLQGKLSKESNKDNYDDIFLTLPWGTCLVSPSGTSHIAVVGGSDTTVVYGAERTILRLCQHLFY
jgi:hypothetical protein